MLVETKRQTKNQWKATCPHYPELPGRNGATEAQAVANLLAQIMHAAYHRMIDPERLQVRLGGSSALINVRRL